MNLTNGRRSRPAPLSRSRVRQELLCAKTTTWTANMPYVMCQPDSRITIRAIPPGIGLARAVLKHRPAVVGLILQGTVWR